jgi:hypothetical protein
MVTLVFACLLVAALVCFSAALYGRMPSAERRVAPELLVGLVALLAAGAVALIHERDAPAIQLTRATAALESAPDATALVYALDAATLKSFTGPVRIASGALDAPRCMVNFHARAAGVGGERSYAWWTPCSVAATFTSVAAVRAALALPPAWGARDEAAVACVPAGALLSYVDGAAAEVESDGRAYAGGGEQYRVLNFDTDWIRAQHRLPESESAPLPALSPTSCA